MKGLNLGLAGRFIDVGSSLAEFVSGRNDPIAFLNEVAQDLYWHEERPLSHWPVTDAKLGVSSGISFLDPYLRWTSPELVIVAGPYGCGKSSLMRLLSYRWADTIGRCDNARVSIVGWEDKLATVKREVERYALEGKTGGSLSSDDARRVVDMEVRIGWTQRHPEDARLISWYCDLVEHRAKRDNVRLFIFDPFNEHDSTRPASQTETQYVAELMTRFRKLVQQLNITLVVITHVSARSYDDNGRIKPFRVANAAGSVQFGNKADRGICVLRTSTLRAASDCGAEEHMLLHFDKTKDEETMGRRGTIACVLDTKTMTLTFNAGATVEARKQWA